MLIEGFAGVRAEDEILHIAPCLPKIYDTISFPYYWHTVRLAVQVSHYFVRLTAENAQSDISVLVEGRHNCLRDELLIPLGESGVPPK